MLRDVLQKLTSKRGASLSMALMLLLVCTTVAGVVLAAATAAVGRQSKYDDMDTRYYSTTSAASLFWDKLTAKDENDNVKGVTVKVRRSCDAKLVDGRFQEDSSTNWQFAIDGCDILTGFSSTNNTLFELVAYDLVLGVSGGNVSFESSHTPRNPTAAQIKNSIDFTATPAVGELNGLSTPHRYQEFTVTSPTSRMNPVTVETEVDDAGNIEFVFRDNARGGYLLRLKTQADIDTRNVQQTLTNAADNTYHLEWETVFAWRGVSLDQTGDDAS